MILPQVNAVLSKPGNTQVAIDLAIATHVAATDPHPQYALGATQTKWPMVADVIDVGETVTVPPQRQLILAESLTNNGNLVNDGKVVLI
ncbi:MAG: hypothetical protein Fur0026_13780 [Sideroxydans sp.]